MNKLIQNIEFVIFDVETTGLNPKSGDRICEIGAVRLKENKEIARFHSLINPGMPMPEGAYQIHHISDSMLQDAPEASQVLPYFLEFTRGSVLAGYNVGFDLSFIENELGAINKKLYSNIPVIDILKMSRKLYPFMSSYSLENFSKSLRINYPQIHRAMDDVELTKKVFRILLEKVEKQNIKDFQSLHNLFGLNLALINQSNNQKIAVIVRAIDIKARLRIRYFTASSGEVTEREVSPKEIKQENNKQYLVGFCYLRNEERTFRIDSIVSLRM